MYRKPRKIPLGKGAVKGLTIAFVMASAALAGGVNSTASTLSRQPPELGPMSQVPTVSAGGWPLDAVATRLMGICSLGPDGGSSLLDGAAAVLPDTRFAIPDHQKIVSPRQTRRVRYQKATLEIGPGAVTSPVDIGITVLTARDIPSLGLGMTNVTEGPRHGYRFTPHPQQFAKQIKVSLPYDPALMSKGFTSADVHTFFYDELRKCWQPLKRVSIDEVKRVVVSLTDHFTDMINATVTVPDHAEPNAFAPTTIKDMKAADPGASLNLISPPTVGSTGDARLSYPIEIPAGRGGLQPQLAITYNSSAGNGWLGLGWDLQVPSIVVDTRWGVPHYDKTKETETYLLNGEQLSPVAHRGPSRARNDSTEAQRIFHARVENQFQKIIRHGTSPSSYWWEAVDKTGTRYLYGGGTEAIDGPTMLTTSTGAVFKWALRRVEDLHGNAIQYKYDRVTDVGLVKGTVPGTQLYLKLINYTRFHETNGPYTIRFVRDSELPNSPRRPDVIIDGRGGFKMVTAELLKKIIIVFRRNDLANPEIVRSYVLSYKKGAFSKSLLGSITPRGANGKVFVGSHEFRYYSRDLGFADLQGWDTGGDAVTAGLFDQGQASGLTGAITDSIGGHGYVGFNPAVPTKQGSLGAKFGFNFSNNTGVLALVDLDGDNLPDKVFCSQWIKTSFTCGRFSYRSNRSGPAGNTTFGAATPVLLPAISRETTRITSVGLEAYFGASIIGNVADAMAVGSSYFSDVNADGLTDLVHEGSVLFNHLDAAGVPTFTLSSAPSPVPVPSAGGAVDASSVVPDYSRIRDENAETSPLHDTVRRWIAPFAGVLQISGDVAITEDKTDARLRYEGADGIRVSIQHNEKELWSKRIMDSDYGAKSPDGVDHVLVQRGDRLYFRVQSVSDGRYDQVGWDPVITYLGVTQTEDINGLNSYRYQASEDFALAGRPGIHVQVPLTGTLRLSGVLRKDDVTTDDIKLLVTKSGSTVFSKKLPWSETGWIQMAKDIDVVSNGTTQDTVQIRVRADSPIDLRKLRWDPAPHLYYKAASDPTLKLWNPDGSPAFQLRPPYDIDLYPVSDGAAPDRAWVAPATTHMNVKTRLATFASDIVTDGTATVTVKRVASPGDLVAKRTVTIANGIVHNLAFGIDVREGEQLYFDYSTLDPKLRSRLAHVGARVEYTPPGLLFPIEKDVPITFHSAASDNLTKNGLFGQHYRGWSYAGYNGNGEWASRPIDEARLIFQKEHYKTACADDGAVKNSLNDGFDKDDYTNAPCSPAVETAFMFAPISDLNEWRGPDDLGWVRAQEMSSSRLGADSIDVPEPSDFALSGSGGPARAVSRLSRTTQTSLSGGVGPAGLSGTFGTSYGDVDFFDMNGDRFPDVVGSGQIQYTTPSGILSSDLGELPLSPAVRVSDSSAGNVSLGGTVAMFKSDARAHVAGVGRGAPKENAASGSQMVPLGLNAGLGGGKSSVSYDLQDVNGDALPDRVARSGSQLMVALNLGYKFAAPEPWGDVGISSGGSESGSLGPSLGFNAGIYDYAGGVSFSKNKSLSGGTLLDVNGDGLLDQVLPTAAGFEIAFNTGAGFTTQLRWDSLLSGKSCEDGLFESIPGGADWKTVHLCDGNTGVGSGVYFTIGVGPVCLVACYIIINPGADVSENMARQEAVLRDVDGDGYLDHVGSRTDGSLTVARNLIGETNLLKSVSRPLGARIDLKYQREGNTYDQPVSRWVLSRVGVFDGHSGVSTNGEDRDGTDTQVTTYRYEGGQYDRLERDFFGYGTVTEEHRDDAGAVYRRVVHEYLNTGFYTKGLPKRERTEDAAGHFFIEHANTYFVRNIQTGGELVDEHTTTAPAFPELRRTTTRFYEGEATAHKATGMTYQYDELGNVIEYSDTGDIGSNDDIRATIGYSACPISYVVGEPTTISISSISTQLRRREADIECATGDVRQVRQFVDNDTAATTDLEYFNTGNLQRVTGPSNLHGDRYALGYEYDNDVATYVTSVTDSFGYVSHATYEPKFGKIESATDTNGNTTRYTYDTFGRLSAVFGPYEQSQTRPTIKFTYHAAAEIPWALTESLDEYRSETDTLDTVIFIDGLKRVMQTKKDATLHSSAGDTPEDVMIVSGRVRFDSLGRLMEQRYPLTEPLGTPGTFNAREDEVEPTRTRYDVLDRPAKTTIPDGTQIRTAYGFGSDRDGTTEFETTITDQKGNDKRVFTNVRQLVTAVEEFPGPSDAQEPIWTSYAYDPLDQLIRIQDAQTNITAISYDALGRRVSVDDPDTGKTILAYDLASNITKKFTAELKGKGRSIAYDYDFTRLASITYPSAPENNVAYTYGTPHAGSNAAGRITNVTDESGRQQRFYGKLGEFVREIKTVASDTLGNSPQSPEVYETSYLYDTFGRLQTLTYPDGEKLSYRYDAGGRVRKVKGAKSGFTYDYVSRMEYDKFEQRAFVQAGNGTHTAWKYRSDNRRIAGITSVHPNGRPFQNLSYAYDDVGDLKQIINDVPVPPASEFGGPSIQTFVYDDLYRLIEATGEYEFMPNKKRTYEVKLAYDSIHNILSKSQTDTIIQPSGTAIVQPKTTYAQTYDYHESQPHAVEHAGERAFSYDLNGNQTGWTHDRNGTRRRVAWDEENRIQLIRENGQPLTYKYNDVGERVIKRGPQGETVYVNDYYTIRNREVATKHIMVGSTRIASKMGKQDKPGGNPAGGNPFEKDIYFYHPDHLGSTAYVTDAAGELFEHLEYFPSGETWVAEATSTQRTPYRFTGKELDEETGLYYFGTRYYDPILGQFVSADPLIAEQPAAAIERPSTLSTYAYASNSPIRFIDPVGTDTWDVLKGFGKGVGGSALGLGVGVYHLGKSAVVGTYNFSVGIANDPAATLKATAIGAWEGGKELGKQAVTGAVSRGRDLWWAANNPGEFIEGVGTIPDEEIGRIMGSATFATALTVAPLKGLGAARPAASASMAVPKFAQTTASRFFKSGAFAGRSIGEVAADLRSGVLAAADLPVEVIVRNGEVLGLNTRSMLALRRAGIDSSQWVIRDLTGNAAAEQVLTQRLLRNELARGSDTIRITGVGKDASFLP